MKILYLQNGNLPDYQADTVLLGLKELEGDDVVDYRRAWFLYADSFGPGKANLAECYGRGFTLYATLPSDAGCDRTDIVEKIKKKFFDRIIWGSIQRNQAYYGGITSIYKPHELAMIDGEDYPGTLVLQDKAVFFKRENAGSVDNIHSIEFGIPESKILKEPPKKTRFMAEYDPLVNRAYIYEDEKSYYQSYADSYFAPTMKKSGFCALRHYEILANYALPYFRLIDQVPATIMTRFPKAECDIVRRLIEFGPAGCETAVDFYDRTIESVMEAVRTKLTTKSIAKYVLDTMTAAAK